MRRVNIGKYTENHVCYQEEEMIVGDWLARREMLTPDKVALIDTLNAGREITYRQWNRAANRTANYLLKRLGIEKGDRVAVLAFNCIEYLDIWFALGKLGGILQNLNWRLTAHELIALVEDAEPRALVYDSNFIETVNVIRDKVPNVRKFIALEHKAHEDDLGFDEREGYPDVSPPSIELDWNDPWVICYTGGTTGTPKGALLTHLAITANAANTVTSWGLTPEDVTILNSPLFHTGGLNVFTAPLVYIGGTSVVCKGFDLDQTFNLLTGRPVGGRLGPAKRVTIWFGVPTMFVMLQNDPRWEAAEFGHLKLLISGGAPCPLPVFEKFWAKGVDFKTGYGLTEAGPNTFWLPPEDVRRKPGAVGFPLFHIDVRVVRQDGTECAADEMGELVIRGPHVCAGYWKDPPATQAAIHPLAVDPHGPTWLHTGDLARRDPEGYYFIVGRLKDMFISGGENVYPSEVDSAMHAHPDVAEAVVIAVPHETWGEVGRALVVLRPGAALSEKSLIEFLRQRLAGYKVPKSVIFVEELPKTGANKVDKKLLNQMYGE
jgi:fatty-acyl-CoA synthase